MVKTQEWINKLNPTYLSVVLLILFTALALISYNKTTACGDLAEFLNNPVRLMNGDLPYRDFWLIFPPGEVYLPFFLYKIFGLHINVILVFLGIVSALIGLLSFLVGRSIFKDNFFSILVSLLIFFNGVGTKYHYYPHGSIYFLFLLMSALFFLKYLNLNETKELFLSSIFLGVAFLFRFYVVGSALLAILCILLIQSMFNQKSAGCTVKSIGVLFSGILVILGITLFSCIEIWHPMVKEVVKESVSHGTQMNLPYFASANALLEMSFMSLEKAMETGSIYFAAKFIYYLLKAGNFLIIYILPFLIMSVSVYYLVGKDLEKSEKVLILFFLLWGVFAFPKALGRSDISHLVHPASPLFFLLIFFLKRSFESNDTKCTKCGFLVVTILLLGSSVPFYLTSQAIGMTEPCFEVVTPHGTLLIEDKSESENVKNIINFINKNTKEGDYIFVTPWYAPPFYALTNRKNPTYYDSLIDVIGRPSDGKQKNICSDLLNKNVKLIIHYSDWGFGSKKELRFLNSCAILQKCIEDNFGLVGKYGHYWVYVPKKS